MHKVSSNKNTQLVQKPILVMDFLPSVHQSIHPLLRLPGILCLCSCHKLWVLGSEWVDMDVDERRRRVQFKCNSAGLQLQICHRKLLNRDRSASSWMHDICIALRSRNELHLTHPTHLAEMFWEPGIFMMIADRCWMARPKACQNVGCQAWIHLNAGLLIRRLDWESAFRRQTCPRKIHKYSALVNG